MGGFCASFTLHLGKEMTGKFYSSEMNGFVLGVLVLIALPCALGIQCYKCKISGPTSLCDKDLSNTTDVMNCSETNLPGGSYDACVTTAVMIKSKIGKMEKATYMMTCGLKALCAKIENDNCGPEGLRKYVDKIPGFEVTKCGVACCQTPMCNTRDIVQPKSLGTNTSASLVVSGIMFVLGSILAA